LGSGGNRVPEAMQFRLIQALTPETTHSTHYFWSQPRNFSLNDATLTETLATSANAGFAEDKAIIEAQQKVIDQNPGAPMMAIAADAGLMRVRRMIDRMLAAEAHQSAGADEPPLALATARE
jgi:phenylpropionate dioxygenase-like ring-hydroxylating dioxygenase large terminal subunit